jgi:hypothetical protein
MKGQDLWDQGADSFGENRKFSSSGRTRQNEFLEPAGGSYSWDSRKGIVVLLIALSLVLYFFGTGLAFSGTEGEFMAEEAAEKLQDLEEDRNAYLQTIEEELQAGGSEASPESVYKGLYFVTKCIKDGVLTVPETAVMLHIVYYWVTSGAAGSVGFLSDFAFLEFPSQTRMVLILALVIDLTVLLTLAAGIYSIVRCLRGKKRAVNLGLIMILINVILLFLLEIGITFEEDSSLVTVSVSNAGWLSLASIVAASIFWSTFYARTNHRKAGVSDSKSVSL